MIECNEEKREITGKIVPFGNDEIGSTNLGSYTFEAGIENNHLPKLLGVERLDQSLQEW